PRASPLSAALLSPASPHPHSPSFPTRRSSDLTAVAKRLDSMPPFWTTFLLVITLSLPQAVLALPIATAGLGPLAGVGQRKHGLRDRERTRLNSTPSPSSYAAFCFLINNQRSLD